MRDKDIALFLHRLNKNINEEFIHLRPISSNVDFAKVWFKKPKPTNNISFPDGPDKFYFIKNSVGLYVAAVFDMTHDLHWYVLNQHRGQGHLTKAMADVILFHLFQDREEQRITIDEYQIGRKNFKASEKVAKNLGFTNSENKEYYLLKEKYSTTDYIYGINTGISEERMLELKKRINYLSRSLWVIQTEIEMKLGDYDYVDELNEIVKELKTHTLLFEDIWWESKRNHE